MYIPLLVVGIEVRSPIKLCGRYGGLKGGRVRVRDVNNNSTCDGSLQRPKTWTYKTTVYVLESTLSGYTRSPKNMFLLRYGDKNFDWFDNGDTIYCVFYYLRNVFKSVLLWAHGVHNRPSIKALYEMWEFDSLTISNKNSAFSYLYWQLISISLQRNKKWLQPSRPLRKLRA